MRARYRDICMPRGGSSDVHSFRGVDRLQQGRGVCWEAVVSRDGDILAAFTNSVYEMDHETGLPPILFSSTTPLTHQGSYFTISQAYHNI